MSKFGIFKFRRPRFYAAWISATLIVIFGRTSDYGFFLGIPIIFLGELVRIWSQGSIQKKVRLSDSGPYAYTRNPLYLGNFLIGLGFVTIFSNLLLMAIFLVGFFFIYNDTIKKEEEYLSGAYGPLFQTYCDQVPRFFPGLRPYANRSGYPFDPKLVLHHGEPITVCALILISIALYLRQVWYQDGGGFLSSCNVLFYTAICVSILLIWFVIQRKRKRPN